MIDFELEHYQSPHAKIKVMGVGGAGCNTVNSIIQSGYTGVEFIVANTDKQALEQSISPTKIHLGVKSTKGLGTGANPELGKRAAEEDLDNIMEHLADADIVFLTAGMGGGTGSGALPVVAKALKEKGILCIAVVTKPFIFEGKRRSSIAHDVIEKLKNDVDTLLVVPNQKLLAVVDQNISMVDAFNMINEILGQSVKGVADIISKAGHINVDFADVKTIMKDRGLALMGTASSKGARRAEEAVMGAISSPLLENMNMQGAMGVLLNITGSTNLSLHEISKATSIIYEMAHPDAQIILGTVVDQSLQDEVRVTVIATGFEQDKTAEKNELKTINKPQIAQPQTIEVATKSPTSGSLPTEFENDRFDIPSYLRNQETETR